MIALSLFGSVVVLAGAGLAGWRWWLQHLTALTARDAGDQAATVKSLNAVVGELGDRVTKLEIRLAGR